jgi:hypothetical protein
MRRVRARRLRVLALLLLLFSITGVFTGCKPKQVVVLPEPDKPPVVIVEEPTEPEPTVAQPPWNDADLLSILNKDNGDWGSYPDLPEEKAAIAEVLGEFTAAMVSKDVATAVTCVFEGQQESYGLLFEAKPEAMPGFGELLAQAEMCFLSESRDPEKTAFLRTAEYKVELDGFAFYIRFIKTAEGWVLYDF